MYYKNGMPDFDRMNRETNEFRSTQVDRYNPSTRSNYNRPNISRLNGETYCHNNGISLSDYYNSSWKKW